MEYNRLTDEQFRKMIHFDESLLYEMGYNAGFKDGMKGSITQDQYEARLKADMVTMLEQLKKEIIELPFPQREPEYMQGYSYCQMNILDYVIQEKIDKLKGEIAR